MSAKESSSRTAGFVAEHGSNDVFELEAVEPAEMTDILDAAIQSVLDMKRYEQERRQEEDDALEIDQARQRAMLALGDFRTSPDVT